MTPLQSASALLPFRGGSRRVGNTESERGRTAVSLGESRQQRGGGDRVGGPGTTADKAVTLFGVRFGTERRIKFVSAPTDDTPLVSAHFMRNKPRAGRGGSAPTRPTTSASSTALLSRTNTIRLLFIVVSLFVVMLRALRSHRQHVSGVRKQVLRPGMPLDGDRSADVYPVSGATVTVHYAGRLVADGTEFDASHRRNRPFTFRLGAAQVIPCWDLAVAGMRRGELARVRCPPRLAYGERGILGVIPPAAELEFDIELLEFANPVPGKTT